MLVFPQTFNYRLIIGTLVIVIAVLGSYSISSYHSFKNQEEFLEQETKLVQSELTEVIALYDDVSIENETVKNQLDESKKNIKTALGSKTKTNLSIISKYKSQVNSLQKEREVIFGHVDSLVKDNEILNVQVDSLSIKNKSLLKTVEEIGVLQVKNIKISALVTTSSLNVYETNKFSETDHLEICTTLASNEFTTKGNKNIYVQILDANNKLVSEKGTLRYEGKHLKYSGKTTIKNISKNIIACLKISISEKEKLEAGILYINVYQNTTLLGSNTILLK